MAFNDLSEYFDPDLHLPIRGKTYRIPAPTAHDGLRLKMLFSNAGVTLSDSGETQEIMKLLGAEWVPRMVEVPVTDDDGNHTFNDDGTLITTTVDDGRYEGGVYQEMCDDGLSWAEVALAGRTVLIDAGLGRLAAEIHWQSGGGQGNPTPPEPAGGNRKTRRAAKKAAPRKATTNKAGGGRTRASRKPTEMTTPEVGTTTPTPE